LFEVGERPENLSSKFCKGEWKQTGIPAHAGMQTLKKRFFALAQDDIQKLIILRSETTKNLSFKIVNLRQIINALFDSNGYFRYEDGA